MWGQEKYLPILTKRTEEIDRGMDRYAGVLKAFVPFLKQNGYDQLAKSIDRLLCSESSTDTSCTSHAAEAVFEALRLPTRDPSHLTLNIAYIRAMVEKMLSLETAHSPSTHLDAEAS